MPKSEVARDVKRKRRPAGSTDALEGRIAELCRDLAVQAKRMTRLQEQADELRTALREFSDRRL